ncbi:SANT/Myb domain [Sesbania bispinosa]|nr:SANT/Myb domain [Sesbania bispinosa]
MPALILDEKEKMFSKFLSSNGLIDDPLAIEKERAMINPWTSEEREIFLEKFAAFGKDFRKIASFLDHKTTADCIEFYYKNHKSDCFEKIKKKDGGKLRKLFTTKTDLMASGKKWKPDMNASSLEILSAASVMAGGITGNRKMRSGSSIWSGYGDLKTSRGEDSIAERLSGFDVLQDERETVAADVLAGICGSLPSEVMSSCINSSVEPVEGNRDMKVRSLCKQSVVPDVTQNIDDGTCSDESCGEMDPTDWTDGEKAAFIQAVSSFGKDFMMIARCVGTRSRDQCKVFFSKARKCLGLDLVHPRPENIGSLVNDDGNGGRSDPDDACVLEKGSVIESDMSGAKTDEDLPPSVMNTYHDESRAMEARDLSADLNESKKMGGAVTELVSASDIIEPCYTNPVADRLVSEVSSGCRGNEFEGSDIRLVDRDDILEADTDVVVELKHQAYHSSTLVNTSVSSVGISCSRLSFDAENQPQFCLDGKPHLSGPLEDPPPTANPMLQNTAGATVQHEKTASQNPLSSTCDFHGSKDISGHSSSSNGGCQLHNPGNLLDNVEAARILQCNPLQVPVKEVNADIRFRKTSRNGDLKLFGKILTNPSSTQNPTLTAQGNEENGTHHPKLSSTSSSLKFTGCHNANRKSTILKFDHNDNQGLENVPIMSYWDGSRKQPGLLSSLPDSAIVLAKYPDAFSNYPTSSKLEQQSLQMLAKNEQHLNGVSAFTTTEVNGSNGVIDYQVFRNRDGLKVQPFLVDVKDHQDVFSETQRINGFEAISSLQQQGRGMVGLNGVGRSGILVGGSGAGVSDPVAAIKMHFSNADQYGSQTGSIMRG